MEGKPIYIVVTPFFPSPTSWRGPFCLDFVKALMRTDRYDVKVFVPGIGEDYEIDGVRVCRFQVKELPSAILPFFYRKQNEQSFLGAVKRAGLNINEIAICHAHTARYAIYPLAIKKLNPSCRTLLHHHDPQSFGLHLGVLRHCDLYNVWLFCQMRRLFEQIDVHVFISEMVKRSFLMAPDASWTSYENYRRQMCGPKFFHCRPARIKCSVILHNGVDTAIFYPRSQPQHPTSTFTIGCIGNFVDWKDQATLIRAIGILTRRSIDKNVKVVFVGSGPTLEYCKVLANSIVNLNLKPQPLFEFRSEVPHEQLADFYHSLDLFVLPSFLEGFGCVFTEAYASGVPFITCEGQGMDDIVSSDNDDRARWFCKPGDAENLAKLIGDYMHDRPMQKLAAPIAIDELVPPFLKEVES